MADNNRETRNIRDLQSLLRACVEATQSENASDDSTNPSRFEEMTAERRQFLENAIKTITIDVVKQLEKAVHLIADTTTSTADKLNAMDVIRDFVENIDIANDFIKIGGLNILLPLLSTNKDGIQQPAVVRSKAASIIANIAQNNEYSQKQLLEANFIPKLIDLLADDETAANGIHALSCEIRNYEPAQAAFIERGGLECLIGCLQHADREKLIVRAIFLMHSLCSDMNSIRDELVKLHATETVIKLLKANDDYDTILEMALGTLNQLTDNSDALNECRKSNLNLKHKLEEIVRLAQNKSQCQEILDYSEILLKKIFEFSSEITAER